MYAIRSYYDGFKAGADINVTDAWETTMGEGIKVGVMGISGIMGSHEDLVDNIGGVYDIGTGLSDIDTNISVITSYSIHYTKLYDQEANGGGRPGP